MSSPNDDPPPPRKLRRRAILAAGAGAAVAAAAVLRPSDAGAPHSPYFSALNRLLQREGPWRPCLVLDLDRVDQNLAVMRQSFGGAHRYRLVAKSLPSLELMAYVLKVMGSTRLMAFHQPFLNQEAVAFPDSDVLLGKPLPVGSAARFYDRLRGAFDPARQLQWLIDSPERLAQYLALAEARGLSLRINIELDVGLHRGGVTDEATLARMLAVIAANPGRLKLSGFMGYEPHVVKIPSVVASRDRLFDDVGAKYQGFVDVVRRDFPALWSPELTLNGGGSGTYRLYSNDTLRNDLAVGSAVVKPTHFDLDTLEDHVPALFIATPVLKVLEQTRLPALEGLSALAASWDPNLERAHFLYGGRWKAAPESPRGLRLSGLYGQSSNQELLTGSSKTGLKPDDHVFLRPSQSEALMLEFGDLVVVRGEAVVARWPVLTQQD